MEIIIVKFAVFIFILVSITIYSALNKRRAKRAAIARERAEQIAKEAAQAEERKRLEQQRVEEQRLKPHKDLILRYAKSELTAKLLFIIGNHNPIKNPPEEIVIYDDRILGKYGDNIFTFDFAEHRVFPFDHVVWGGEDKELKYVVKPQLAMAQAINILLDSKYAVMDHARTNYSHHEYSDGELYTTVSYTSDHVVMKLKSTLPNRSF